MEQLSGTKNKISVRENGEHRSEGFRSKMIYFFVLPAAAVLILNLYAAISLFRTRSSVTSLQHELYSQQEKLATLANRTGNLLQMEKGLALVRAVHILINFQVFI